MNSVGTARASEGWCRCQSYDFFCGCLRAMWNNLIVFHIFARLNASECLRFAQLVCLSSNFHAFPIVFPSPAFLSLSPSLSKRRSALLCNVFSNFVACASRLFTSTTFCCASFIVRMDVIPFVCSSFGLCYIFVRTSENAARERLAAETEFWRRSFRCPAPQREKCGSRSAIYTIFSRPGRGVSKG